jgi:cell growth-regulating nucleolar protein
MIQECGDVLTKKKLDNHRMQCHGASFTCLDCMVHFMGMDYRGHTVRQPIYKILYER